MFFALVAHRCESNIRAFNSTRRYFSRLNCSFVIPFQISLFINLSYIYCASAGAVTIMWVMKVARSMRKDVVLEYPCTPPLMGKTSGSLKTRNIQNRRAVIARSNPVPFMGVHEALDLS